MLRDTVGSWYLRQRVLAVLSSLVSKKENGSQPKIYAVCLCPWTSLITTAILQQLNNVIYHTSSNEGVVVSRGNDYVMDVVCHSPN